MVTLVLQCSVAVLHFAFGVLSLAIGRRIHGHVEIRKRVAWILVGTAFVLSGVNRIVQNIGAVWAFLSGEASQVYATYIEWAPTANHSRTLLFVALYVALILLGIWRSPRRSFLAVSFAALLGAMLIGGVVGRLEGSLVPSRHFSAVAVVDAVGALTLMAALLSLLVGNAVDRILWICLCLYALSTILDILWFSGLTGMDLPGVWSPSPSHMYSYRFGMILAMHLLAVRRLWLARRDVDVPALLEPLAARRPSYL